MVWLLACTLTAGWQKVFDANPKIGFLAQSSRYQDALARGELLAPAKSLDQMHQIILNNQIDAGLTAFFMLVVLSILVFGARTCYQAYRVAHPTTQEVGAPGTSSQGAAA